jgi:hypothetical protein
LIGRSVLVFVLELDVFAGFFLGLRSLSVSVVVIAREGLILGTRGLAHRLGAALIPAIFILLLFLLFLLLLALTLFLLVPLGLLGLIILLLLLPSSVALGVQHRRRR